MHELKKASQKTFTFEKIRQKNDYFTNQITEFALQSKVSKDSCHLCNM